MSTSEGSGAAAMALELVPLSSAVSFRDQAYAAHQAGDHRRGHLRAQRRKSVSTTSSSRSRSACRARRFARR